MLQISTVSKEFEICMGHRLQNHTGKCRHLHGHNYRIKISVRGFVKNDSGMVLDFSSLKNAFAICIKASFDHRTILEAGDPLFNAISSVSPGDVDAVLYAPTAENLAANWQGRLVNYFKDLNLDLSVRVKVWETASSCADTGWR